MKLAKLFKVFVKSGQASGLVLIGCTIFSLIAANLALGYAEFWYLSVGHHTITHWINDGLLGRMGFTMSIFISLLAFDNAVIIDQSKLAILLASLISGVVGFLYLKRVA